MRTAADRRAAWRRGLRAEGFVADRLQARGWEVLARNWYAAGGEIDLVVRRDGMLRFVEVRSRQVGDDTGLESISYHKRRCLIRAANAWLVGCEPESFVEAAFLVAIVTIDADRPGVRASWTLELVDDAFDGA